MIFKKTVAEVFYNPLGEVVGRWLSDSEKAEVTLEQLWQVVGNFLIDQHGQWVRCDVDLYFYTEKKMIVLNEQKEFIVIEDDDTE